MTRAVATLAAQAGIDQFIDIGTGIPCPPNVHQTARRWRRDARVVYVDNDAGVMSHIVALLATDPGLLALGADARDPDAILSNPAVCQLIDFDRPVAVLFGAVLPFIADDDHPRAIVDAFRRRLVPDSALLLSHIGSDGTPPEVLNTITEAYAPASTPVVFRSTADIRALFGDLHLVQPGLVDLPKWRPDLHTTRVRSTLRVVGGVAQLP
jgi:hypothetical protein